MLIDLQCSTSPLAALPSVLAIRDLRQRVLRSYGQQQVTRDSLEQLLALDPPAALRALRMAQAPVFTPRQGPWTIHAIAAELGPSMLRRALDVSPIDVVGTGPIRVLWLHSIATAHAARSLSRSSGIWDPEQAYLGGLLHDLDRWLHAIARRTTGMAPAGTVAEWLRHWHMPDELSRILLQAAECRDRPGGLVPHDEVTLLSAAEMLAELADFPHPDQGDAAAHDLLLTTADRQDLLAAQRLRRDMQSALQTFGLDLVHPDQGSSGPDGESNESLKLFPSKQTGDLSEIVLSVLNCNKAPTYRSIVTATTAASLRYLSYDRAFFIKWMRRDNVVSVRAKADLSARRLFNTRIQPNDTELAALQATLAKDRPVRVDCTRNGEDGLLRWLSADDALLVPVSREFASPTFLLLDRTVSTRPVHLLQDADKASTLGNVASLLTENLLLKRRRQRAQKFALTDPLTRLFNRSMGIKTLDQEIGRAQRTGSPLTVLMVDLDEFKKLNDRFGHVVGDQALRATAEVLRKTLRKTDMVCRYGGEEFLVVLPDTEAEQATVLAARLFTAVEARGQEMKLPITVSIGMSALQAEDDVEKIVNRADEALYASKEQGRNRFSVNVESN